MKTVDYQHVEDAARELYIRALTHLPDDIKEGFGRLQGMETSERARNTLGTMVTNIKVAEDNDNLLCQDTGIPIYNVFIGRNYAVDGWALKEAIRTGCERATREHPLRSSVVHPISRKNNHTSCGPGVPVIHVDFVEDADTIEIEMLPPRSGSVHNPFLRMPVPAEGRAAVKRVVIDCVSNAGGKTCPPTIVSVGVGGASALCVRL